MDQKQMMQQECNITDRQLIAWASGQRIRHTKGLLQLSKKKKLESLPGWHWKMDFKTDAIEKCHDVFKRAQERGSLPKITSKDPQERKDYRWLVLKRQAKTGNSRSLWLSVFEDIAKEYGYDDAFNLEILKTKILNKCYEIFVRAKDRGSLPKGNSKDIQERHDAQWIQNKRRAKLGKRGDIWHPEFEQIAKELGYPNAFKQERRQDE